MPDTGFIDQHKDDELAKTVPFINFSKSPRRAFCHPTAVLFGLDKRIQPGVSATYGGLAASFWGNFDLTDEIWRGDRKWLLEVRRRSAKMLDFQQISVPWSLSDRCIGWLDGQEC